MTGRLAALRDRIAGRVRGMLERLRGRAITMYSPEEMMNDINAVYLELIRQNRRSTAMTERRMRTDDEYRRYVERLRYHVDMFERLYPEQYSRMVRELRGVGMTVADRAPAGG